MSSPQSQPDFTPGTSTALVSIGTSLAVDPKQAVSEFLALEGLRVECFENGNIGFEYLDRAFYLHYDHDDPEFVVLAMPNIAHVSPADTEKAEHLCYRVANKVKAAKLSVMPDGSVWVQVEWLIASPVQLLPVFLRTCEGLIHAAGDFWTLQRFS